MEGDFETPCGVGHMCSRIHIRRAGGEGPSGLAPAPSTAAWPLTAESVSGAASPPAAGSPRSAFPVAPDDISGGVLPRGGSLAAGGVCKAREEAWPGRCWEPTDLRGCFGPPWPSTTHRRHQSPSRARCWGVARPRRRGRGQSFSPGNGQPPRRSRLAPPPPPTLNWPRLSPQSCTGAGSERILKDWIGECSSSVLHLSEPLSLFRLHPRREVISCRAPHLLDVDKSAIVQQKILPHWA